MHHEIIPLADDVAAAVHRLRGIVDRTPLVAAPSLGQGYHLKCENLQRTGSFKIRGAYNALVSLSAAARARG
ncbi:MAG: pyridoxal-phosphate dependent enzyme, partial [Gemmatimonadaceae bacterium]|nr:pyridoxal-phosphate dependent enzyme [Gemmatimonadaceae bacterium]